MHGDFSRITFDPLNRFSAVVALQGRIDVEADANEQSAILQHYLRTLAADVLGPQRFVGGSFEVKWNAGSDDLTVGWGHGYVDGILVENTQPADANAALHSFYAQPDAYFEPDDPKLPDPPFYVYLEVWERLITVAEQPPIRDVALGAGGPDSSARTKVVWQIRVTDTVVEPPVPALPNTAWDYWGTKQRNKLVTENPGALVAATTTAQEDELCALSPDAGYRGLENQLYRVEIHTGGTFGPNGAAPPSFVWSRDNGSVVFPIVRREGDTAFVLSTLGRDDRYGLTVDDWVEVVDDATVLMEEPADLRQVTNVDAARLTVTLDGPVAGDVGSVSARHPLLRRWDQQPTQGQLGAGNGVRVGAGAHPLEDGIEVTFSQGTYRAGDYWSFPARFETGRLEWPDGEQRFPDGVVRHFAPIAYVRPADIIDLRQPPP